jgi:geranylgeranyl pyrophosphate synthase
MTAWLRGHAPTIDEVQVLDTVQGSLRALIAAAPWPRALAAVAIDVLSEPTRVLGGRLTPWAMLPLCCCAAACGDWRPALRAATAAELYHAASDICDDIEDGDLVGPIERHGIPIMLNLATALLALMHRALEPATPSESVACRRAQDALWEGVAVAAGGQHLDLAAAGAAPLSVEDCLDIARRKGGALAEACCRAGAAFGTTEAPLIERFGLLGRAIGLFGQIDNDMHDAGDGVRKSDLAQRKQTVPIAVARASNASAPLGDAVWRGGIQLAYALVHAERARAQDALEAAAAACPNPAFARTALAPLLVPRGRALAEMPL